VQLGEDKMSKSLGNLITIKQALEKYSPDAIRIFVLSSHYRSPLKYSEEALGAAKSGLDRLAQAISRNDSTGGKGMALEAQPYYNQFIEAMDDDFNTPQALGVLFDLVRAINQAADSGISFMGAQTLLFNLYRNVFGLRRRDVVIEVPTGRLTITTYAPTVVIGAQPTPEIKSLIEERNRLRKAKKWQEADKIRAKLAEMGITLEDTPESTIIRPKRKK
jgi:cysteinyl-tRNA synthetase